MVNLPARCKETVLLVKHEDERVRFGFVGTNAYVARMVPLAYPP